MRFPPRAAAARAAAPATPAFPRFLSMQVSALLVLILAIMGRWQSVT